MRTSGENIKIQLGNGLIVNYDDNGPVFAPAVIFIHGSPFNKSVWDLQTEALKNNYRVISYDLRGHGETAGTSDDLSIGVHSADLIDLMERLEVPNAVLCGLSLGTYIAMDAIEKHPSRFNGLVLSGVQCVTDSTETKTERSSRLAKLRSKGIDAFVEDSIRLYFSSRSFISRKEEVRSVRSMMLQTKPESIFGTFHALDNRREYCTALRDLKVPVMILMGSEDLITPVSAARNVQDNIKGAAMFVIEYAGHLANLENTHEYNEHLKRFVDHLCKTLHLSKHCEAESVTESRSRKLKV
jgi:3-oxoadipate enol-lactonase